MNRQIEQILHKGKMVVYSDYSGLAGQEFVEVIMEHHRQHRELIESGKTGLLVLTNVGDTMADREVTRTFKETAKRNVDAMAKSAVIGVVGIQKVLLHSINLFSSFETKPFDTKEAALDWLAE